MLKGYTIQHLPDGTVIVESIVIKVSSSVEDANTKIILLSWSYQVKHFHCLCINLYFRGLKPIMQSDCAHVPTKVSSVCTVYVSDWLLSSPALYLKIYGVQVNAETFYT